MGVSGDSVRKTPASAELTPPVVVVMAPNARSPPSYPDFCGRRRLQLEVQMLNREVGFLEEELKYLEGVQPVSRDCKDVNNYVGTKVDPMIPSIRRRTKSCGIWRCLRSKLCFDFTWTCCSSGCFFEDERVRCPCQLKCGFFCNLSRKCSCDKCLVSRCRMLSCSCCWHPCGRPCCNCSDVPGQRPCCGCSGVPCTCSEVSCNRPCCSCSGLCRGSCCSCLEVSGKSCWGCTQLSRSRACCICSGLSCSRPCCSFSGLSCRNMNTCCSCLAEPCKGACCNFAGASCCGCTGAPCCNCLDSSCFKSRSNCLGTSCGCLECCSRPWLCCSQKSS